MAQKLYVQCVGCPMICDAMPISRDMVDRALKSSKAKEVKWAKGFLKLNNVIVVCKTKGEAVLIDLRGVE